jgi:rhamnose transport system permease protein
MTTGSPTTTPAPAPRARQRAGSRSRLREGLVQPEVVTTILLLLAFVAGALLSPYFLDFKFLLNNTSVYIEVGIMALGLTFVIISNNIDLSVSSMLALVGCIAGVLFFNLHIAMGIAIVVSVLCGVGLGWLNGYMITRVKLPSLTVTLGTLALYRGVANILLGDESLPKLAFAAKEGYPKWFTSIDQRMLPGTPIPMPLVIFLVLAVVLGLLLHRTTFGRTVYAIGTNEPAARYAGIDVDRIKILIFTLSGFLCALAGLIMVSRLGVSRYDHARGWELDAITAVVLGGTSISGGRGSIFGTVMAFLLIVILRTGMGVANVKAESQLTVIGVLLIVSVVASNLLARRGKS